MKNILSLILRSIFIIIISLYTTRILYNEIGEVDYGIFGLILGLTAIINIFTNSMNNSFQRFFNINYSNKVDIERIFTNSMVLSLWLGMILSFLLLLIDIKFIDRLNIPDYRIYAAKIFSYYCIFSVFLSIVKIPFIALLSSKQEVNKIVIISIIESILKLLFTASLIYVSYDNLIIYGLFLSLINIISLLITYYFARKYIYLSIKEFDKTIVLTILSFLLTNSIGNFTPIINNQVLSVEINYIDGTKGSSLNTLASQVNASFVSMMGMMHIVYAPMITKQFIENKITECSESLFQFTKYLYVISILIISPIIVFVELVFLIWIGNVPDRIQLYVSFYLIISLIEVISAPLWVIANAEGKIFRYQIIMLIIGLLFLPISLYLTIIKADTSLIILSLLIINTLIFIYRVVFTCNILSVKFKKYFDKCIVKPTILFFFIIVLGTFINRTVSLNNIYMEFIFKVLSLEVVTIILILMFLLSAKERFLLNKIIFEKIRGSK